MSQIFPFISGILLTFNVAGCFTRYAAFVWFCVVILSFMMRTDNLGVTSFIRTMQLNPKNYECLIHFFHADSWNLESIRTTWARIVREHGNMHTEIVEHYDPETGETTQTVVGAVLVVDGTSVPTETHRSPITKALHSNSQDSSKPHRFFGMLFGVTGVICGGVKKFCVPLMAQPHEGNEYINKWTNKPQNTQIVQGVIDAHESAESLEVSYAVVVLDRLYMAITAFLKIFELNSDPGNKSKMCMITRAKNPCTAYETMETYNAKHPGPHKGRKRKYNVGDPVRIFDLFQDSSVIFTKVSLLLYGKMENIEYYCTDLLWNRETPVMLRFVLVKKGNSVLVLVCSDLDMKPTQIIRLYSYRFRIEECFRESKLKVGMFNFHFWSIHMPKVNFFAKSGEEQLPLNDISEEDKKYGLSMFKAIQGHVQFACIAVGILQMIAMKFGAVVNSYQEIYLRTRPNENAPATEGMVMMYLRDTFWDYIGGNPNSFIGNIIIPKMRKSAYSKFLLNSRGQQKYKKKIG